jgi:nucleotide-binding universal stress UspA family protein
MTTHGRSALGRLLFGSVAETVMRRANIPVFIVRAAEDAQRSAAASADAEAE